MGHGLAECFSEQVRDLISKHCAPLAIPENNRISTNSQNIVCDFMFTTSKVYVPLLEYKKTITYLHERGNVTDDKSEARSNSIPKIYLI